MGGGHDHHHKVEIPDYRIYKVEDVPELVRVQKNLAKLGLKDPWLRNEVWRYNVKEFGTLNSRVKTTVFRGFKYGFGAFVITTLLETAYEKMYPDTHGHGGGHH